MLPMEVSRLLLSVVVLTLAACHSMTTQRVGLDDKASDAEVASVWADNTATAFMDIRKADGQRTYSVVTDSTPPYSIKIAPGKHVLTVFIQDLAPRVPLTYPPVTSVSAELEVDVELLAGHAYALRHRQSPDGKRVMIEAVDLGVGKACKYVPAGSLTRGYQPVKLVCQ